MHRILISVRRKISERGGDAVGIGEFFAAYPSEGSRVMIFSGTERRLVRVGDAYLPAREGPLDMGEHMAGGRERRDRADREALCRKICEHFTL